ncbi:hypothetical protein HAX54_023866 [Datura stramonium]|uniref:Autophagy-related protein 9 n=1 Tax=Datura stramonium TaxID=4076 RepID=A0ABS8RK24_DATST|nr:hypothetical protein [Datura stramonium]
MFPLCEGSFLFIVLTIDVTVGLWSVSSWDAPGTLLRWSGMYERTTDFIKYMVFWLVVLGAKFAFAYFLLIRPLVKPTIQIVDMDISQYSWHDFVSKNNHNAMTLCSLWAIHSLLYTCSILIYFTLLYRLYGAFFWSTRRLGEIRSLDAMHKLFERFPEAFANSLHVPLRNRVERIYEDIRGSITKRSINVDADMNAFATGDSATALMGILKKEHTPELETGAVKAILRSV